MLGVQQLSDLVSPVSGEGGPQMCWECSNLVSPVSGEGVPQMCWECSNLVT